MLYENSAYLWLTLFIVLFLCELYVPYRKKTALSFMSGCVASIVFSEFEKSLFYQCVFFLAFSFFAVIFTFAVESVGRIKKPIGDRFAEVIVLCDIPKQEYGAVCHFGKSHIIKNSSGRFIKKGETLQIPWQELEDSNV